MVEEEKAYTISEIRNSKLTETEEKELEEAKEWLSNKIKEEINLLISEYMETVRPYYNKIKVPIVL